MTISTRNGLLSLFFAVAIVGCGGGGGGGDDGGSGSTGANTGNNPPGGDVSVEQLNGTWLGTFDAGGSVRTMTLTVDAGNITAVSLDGASTNLSGPITKADGVGRAFKFELNNQDTPPQTISTGTLFVHSGASHLVYLDQFFGFGALEKGATALPTFNQADLNDTWTGQDVFTTNGGFTTFTRRDTSAVCTAANATTSGCTVTISDGPARASSDLTQDHSQGRFIGTYADTPTSGSPANGTTRVYLSADKSFAAVWNCVDYAGGFPDTCDFSTWKK